MKVILVNGIPNANGCTFTGMSIIQEIGDENLDIKFDCFCYCT